MPRREFSTQVYAQIVRRAMNADGQIVCEGCGLPLGKKPYHVDHTIPDALYLDKSRKLTAADGKLLGVQCCHAPKTRVDQGDIAKAKRREARHHGFASPKRPMQGRQFPRTKEPRTPKPMPPARNLYTERVE